MAKCSTSKWRRARRNHKCCECHGQIQRGELYFFFSGIWDGPASFKQCRECHDFMDEINKNHHWEDFIPFEGLYEDLLNSDDPELQKRFNEYAARRGSTRLFTI